MNPTRCLTNRESRFKSEYLDYFNITTKDRNRSPSPEDGQEWDGQGSEWEQEQSLPSWFTRLLEDYSLSLRPAREMEFAYESTAEDQFFPSICPRIDAILHYALARVKAGVQRSWGSKKDEKDNGLGWSLSPAKVTARLETLFWDYRQKIFLACTADNESGISECSADCVLWYGDQRKLQTNLVVIRAKKLVADLCEEDVYYDVLAAMSLIQHNRTTTGGHDETYGILTDGSRWVFLHLNSKNEISSIILDWTMRQESAIVCQICRILNKTLTIKLLLREDEWVESLQHPSVWDGTIDSESEDGVIDGDTNPISMKFLEKLDAKLSSLQQRLKDPKMRKEVDNLRDMARVESHAQEAKAKKMELPNVAVTDIEPLEIEKTFGLRIIKQKDPSWALGSTEKRPVPHCLRQMLDNYTLAYGDDGGSEAAIRSRVDTILLTVLAERKREEFSQYADKRASAQSATSVKSLHWGCERTLKFPCIFRDQRSLITGRADYFLWYGSRQEAETNMVVVEAKKLGAVNPYQALCYVGMIRKARKEAGRANYPLFAIATDSYDWRFIRVDPNGKVSLLRQYSWFEGEEVDVISQLHRILGQAATLSPTNTLDKQNTVEEQTGMEVD